MAKIAIIDDAILDSRLRKPVLKRYCMVGGKFCLTAASTVADRHYSHGTLVAKILEKYSTEYEIISIQILDDWFSQRICSTSRLIEALILCTQIDVDLIHCSIGSERLSHIRELDKVLETITQSGIPIIAACSNAKYRTLPASCFNVYGVMCDEQDVLPEGTFSFVRDPYLSIEFIANYQPCFFHNVQFARSSSLAAPVVTARVNDILNQGVDRSVPAILRILKHHAWIDIPYDALHNRRFRDPASIPIVYLVDIFTQEGHMQSALLDMFATNEYEVAGISLATNVNDVRLLRYYDVCHQSPRDIQDHIIASTKSDLLLVFLDTVNVRRWENSAKSDTAILRRTDLDEDTMDDLRTVYDKVLEFFN